MAESDITALIATTDNDTTWGDHMRGAMTTINTRLANPRLKPVVGAYYDQQWLNPNPTNEAGTRSEVADRIVMVPVSIPETASIDRIGALVTATGTATVAKFVIYTADADGYPDTLLLATSTVAVATNLIELTISQSLTPGMYWVGIRLDGTATLRTYLSSRATQGGGMPLTISTSNAFRYVYAQRTLAFATAATDPWVFAGVGDLVANNQPPVIVMRAA